MTNNNDLDLSVKQEYGCLAYGLNISSHLPLPETFTVSEGKNDLIITESFFQLPKLYPTSIYRQGREAHFGTDGNLAFLHWEGVASFRAENGTLLSVMKATNDVSPQLLNLYLLSEALGLILPQRGYFLLHGSAVRLKKGVIVFLGVPGAGKSTIAGAFAKKGYTVVTDDMVALEIKDQVSFIPAFPQLKLWENSVTGLKYNTALTEPLFQGSRKRVIKSVGDFPYKEILPLSAIYLLETSSDINIDKITAQEAIINLTRFFSCPHQLLSKQNLPKHFQQCKIIASQIPIYRLSLPRNFEILETIVQKLIIGL